MKFLKENWFKLMTGTSMLVFSFGFLMYAVSPSYANQTSENKTPKIEDEVNGKWVIIGELNPVKMNIETGEAFIMMREYTGSYGNREVSSHNWEKIN